MTIAIQTTSQNSFLVNNKEVYADQEGCIRETTPLTDLEKTTFLNHYKKHVLKMNRNTPSDKKLAVELISYYQRRENLLNEAKGTRTATNFNSTLQHYNDKIATLRKQLHEINPGKLQKIDTQRANDCTVNSAEVITHRS